MTDRTHPDSGRIITSGVADIPEVLIGAIMGAAYDFRDAHISGSRNLMRTARAELESAVRNTLHALAAGQDTAAQAAVPIRASHGQAPAGAAHSLKRPVQLVYLVATGETRNGTELYERHDKMVHMADVEVLYKTPELDGEPSPSPQAAQQAPAGAVPEPRACEILSLGEWCSYPLDRYEEAQANGRKVRLLYALDDATTAQDSVQEDAARYRYLRDVPMDYWPAELLTAIRLQQNTKWDAAIDAARAAQEGK